MTTPPRASTTDREGFRWLHLSDIHVGLGQQAQLWPRFGNLLMEDLDRLMGKTGGVDLVIFSGDLVQKGDRAEFIRFNEIIGEIIDRVARSSGTKPMLVTTPGNHDLSRPAPLDSNTFALKNFWQHDDLRDAFWEDSGVAYRSFIGEVFHNYTSWLESAVKTGLHLRPAATGLLPGDASYVVRTASGRLGIASLNSTWLQLGAGSYKGELHVDCRQLHAVTNARPDDWARDNDVSLLVTHHPSDWLRSGGLSSWNNDINPPGRFDLHLFGHMHEPETLTTSHGGGFPRLEVQAASLFGLETFGDGQHTRIQGYALSRITHGGKTRVLTGWPRRLSPMTGGKMKLVPDTNLDIDEETSSYSVSYNVSRFGDTNNLVSASLLKIQSSPVSLVPTSVFDLSSIRHPSGDEKAHQKVRRVEQNACIVSLLKDHAVWVASDWGMGEEGFISALRIPLNVPSENIFGIPFNGYTTREALFDRLQARFCATFQQICEAVVDAGPSIFVFDDVDVPLSISNESAIVADIESLATTVAEFGSNTFVVIKTRRLPRFSTLHITELKPLDEADVAIYARESRLGNDRFAKPDAASTLLRHSDGVPARLDAVLRDLEIISLEDLLSADLDVGRSEGSATSAPPALISTIQDLRGSDDRGDQRAYNLLLALAALPQGEQLPRLKRFLGPHQFGPDHARKLLERSLITTIQLATLDGMSNAADRRALVVPRPVRDYVRETTNAETARSVDNKALSLYFGDEWSKGDIRNSPTGRRVRAALCDGYEIQNAGTLILRTMRRAIDASSKLDIGSSLRLALAFADALMTGDHFRSATGLCDDLLRLLHDTGGFDKQIAVLRCQHARSLRMTGRVQEASTVFRSLDHSVLNKADQQHATLGLALCLQGLHDPAAAVEEARKTIEIDEHSNMALQAQTIIADLLDDETEREAELRRLLEVAQHKERTTLVNNILILQARDQSRRGLSAHDTLKHVVRNARSRDDFYNFARAMVDLAAQTSPARLTIEERGRLIEAYHFLYNERLYDLFDRCHEALWELFEVQGDRANLLNLFRHSSFIWRLNGRDRLETKYLAKLVKSVEKLVATGLAQAGRDGAYFVVRVSVVLGGFPDH